MVQQSATVERAGWPPGETLRLVRLRERAWRDRAKAKRDAVDATRGRLLALAPLLRKERELQPGCELLDSLAGRVEKALADAAPIGLGDELRELLRVELATEQELEGMLERLRYCLRPLLGLEWELLRALEKGRAAPALVVARAEVAELEAGLQDRRAEAELRWRLVEAADEAERLKTPPPSGQVWDGLQAAVEETDIDWLAFDEALDWLPVDLERWWDQLERRFLDWGAFGPEWEEWAEAVDAVGCAEYSLKDAREQLELLETGRAAA